MSNSPEIECNCDSFKLVLTNGIRKCLECGRKYRAVPNGQDDYEWEEIE